MILFCSGELNPIDSILVGEHVHIKKEIIMRSKSNPTIVIEVVADTIENMSEAEKATVANTPEDDLTLFHHGWGPRSARILPPEIRATV